MPFFFAWCGPNEPFSAAHQREDEAVFAFDIAHQEGQIPTLDIDIKNPHIGLLAPGRLQWAWLSYASGTGVFPLFYGRLVALPTNLLGETVTLQFVARPNDYLAQKQAIANALMVEPFYDQIWIDQTKWGDPDTVLETYARNWHVDRITHEVSVSEIVFGEDGTEEFQAEDSFYDSVSISFAQSPQTQVVFDGTIQWTQVATGVIAMPDVSLSAWNGQQIINDWPKSGDQLRNGWSVEYAAITNWSASGGGTIGIGIDIGGGQTTVGTSTKNPLGGGGANNLIAGGAGVSSGLPTYMPGSSDDHRSFSFNWQNKEKTHINGDCMSISESGSYNSFGAIGGGAVTHYSSAVTVGSPSSGQAASLQVSVAWQSLIDGLQTAPSTSPTVIIVNQDGTSDGPITVPSLFGQLWLRYDMDRSRTETINFIMNSDVQPIVLLPPDESVNQIKLSMHGSDVGLPIDPGGALPIGDPGRSSFFPTGRGLLAMQYPMLVARANLAQSARAAKVTFDCTFERALDLSCRKNALLHDPRLPGGRVIGKITEYHLKADGDRGQLIGQVQLESTIGEGTSITLREGEPTYVAVDYVVPGYQFYSDADVGLPTGDANIVMPPTVLVDDGAVAPLTFGQAVMVFQVHEGTPIDVVMAGGAASADPTWLEIVLMPVTDQKFTANYDLGYSTLVLPKLIDLAGAHSA